MSLGLFWGARADKNHRQSWQSPGRFFESDIGYQRKVIFWVTLQLQAGRYHSLEDLKILGRCTCSKKPLEVKLYSIGRAKLQIEVLRFRF